MLPIHKELKIRLVSELHPLYHGSPAKYIAIFLGLEEKDPYPSIL